MFRYQEQNTLFSRTTEAWLLRPYHILCLNMSNLYCLGNMSSEDDEETHLDEIVKVAKALTKDLNTTLIL